MPHTLDQAVFIAITPPITSHKNARTSYNNHTFPRASFTRSPRANTTLLELSMPQARHYHKLRVRQQPTFNQCLGMLKIKNVTEVRSFLKLDYHLIPELLFHRRARNPERLQPPIPIFAIPASASGSPPARTVAHEPVTSLTTEFSTQRHSGSDGKLSTISRAFQTQATVAQPR